MDRRFDRSSVQWVSCGFAYGYDRGSMAMVFEGPFSSSRLHQERYEELTSTFDKCDCTSYSYLALSVVLFTVGTTITIFAFDDVADGHVLSNLGHMWLIGPIFICSGLMVAVKCMLYLRRKSLIHRVIFHQHHFFRNLQELADSRGMNVASTSAPGPPSYEVIAQGSVPNEMPPPSYAEAIAFLHRSTGSDVLDAKSLGCGTVSCSSIAVAENIRRKP